MIDAPPVESRPTELRPLDRFMIAAVTALALTVAVSVVSIASDIHRLSVLRHLVADASSKNLTRLVLVDLPAAHASDNQTSVIGGVEVVLFVITAVCFIAWFQRAYGNLLRLGAATTRHGTGWAIGGWFVPILNLWRPKQIANDIWRGSDPRHPDQQPSWRAPVSPLVWFWWAAWLLAGLVGRGSTQAWTSAANAGTAHAIRSATGLDIATECTSVLAACLAIAVVHTLTKRERQRARAGQLVDQTAGGNCQGTSTAL